MTAARRLDAVPTLDLPEGYELDALHIGGDGQEVLVVSSAANPTVTDGRQVHKDRDARRNIVLVVAIQGPAGVCLVGPNPAGGMAGPLPTGQATRILQAGLDESTALAARRRLIHLLEAVETNDDLAGVTNAGLFASHYLTTSVRERDDWSDRTVAAQPLLNLRSGDLIEALGYQSQGLGAGALLLSTTEGPVHAVAVLMTEREGFDASADRFGASPVQYGLAKAHQERVPWLIVLRGSQIRLYPVRPDAGVGRRSQAETYLELDLSVVDDRTAGFLPLVFAAGSLDDQGAVQELLEGSIRYAAALGERLRERVHHQVVPRLAVAVANDLERLGQGDDLQAAYRITLKILFRLLFQAYAEDQGLLPHNRNDRYTRNSLTTQANDFVERPDRELDSESHAIWADLRQVWEVIDTGNADWDVPAYNGGLFGMEPDLRPDGHLIDQMRLDDQSVGTALRFLLIDETSDGDVGAIDFRSLSVREFGTIYEGLLESSLSRAETDLALDKNAAYVPTEDPEQIVVNAGEIYHHNASGERKATGSYFTKPFAVEHLLERALVPTLEEHLNEVGVLLDDDKPAAAAEKFFDFKVADLAMGSGHFLIAAIDRMEVEMAAFLTDHPIPAINQELDRLEAVARTALGTNADDYAIEPSALLRRQIARRCLYGIDVNEVAVELARVAVWIHTFVPGLPMSSLDHTLVCANSLTGMGTIDEALDALEPDRKVGMASLFAVEIEQALADARRLLVDAANSSEATKAEVKAAAEAARSAAEAAAPTRLLFDAAVAARIGELPEVAGSAADIEKLASGEHVQRRLAELNSAHMPFLFPEVFLRERAGFDVLVGNPPWEKLHVEENAWWALRFPGLRGLPAKDREARLAELRATRPELVTQWAEEVERVADYRHVVASGPYPGIGAAHLDLFQAFAWRNWQLLRDGGRVGLVLPRGALSGSGTVQWRQDVLANGGFADVCFLVNNRGWIFAGVHMSYTVALVVAGRGQRTGVRFCGPFASLSEYQEFRDQLVQASTEDFSSWSASYAFPLLGAPQTLKAFETMRKNPNFIDVIGDVLQPMQGDVNSTNQKPMFDFDVEKPTKNLPVLTGASIHVLSPDHARPYAFADRDEIDQLLLERSTGQTSRKRSPLFGLSISSASDLSIRRARLAYRRTVRSTDTRTSIPCLVPPEVALTEQAPFFVRRPGGSAEDEAYLLGLMASIPFDWYVRRWVELNLSFEILNAVPLPVKREPFGSRLIVVTAMAAATDDRFSVWAQEIGVPIGTVADSSDHNAAVAEADALSALLYGLGWDEVVYIFETFHRGWDYTERLAAVRLHYDRWRAEV